MQRLSLRCSANIFGESERDVKVSYNHKLNTEFPMFSESDSKYSSTMLTHHTLFDHYYEQKNASNIGQHYKQKLTTFQLFNVIISYVVNSR